MTGKIWGHRLMVLGCSAVSGIWLGCETPARSKFWRHAKDPAVLVGEKPLHSPRLGGQQNPIDHSRVHTLRVHMEAPPKRLNPLFNPSKWAVRISFDTIFEPLLRYRPAHAFGSRPQFEPVLAQSWEFSQGGREIRLFLHPEAHFHDGRSVYSVDVQFSIDTMRSSRKGNMHFREQLRDVVAVELMTSRSLRVRLARPNGFVLRALSKIPIVPAHVYGKRNGAGKGNLVGSGPYRLASSRNDKVHLTRVDQYWAKPVAIRDIEFIYEPDAGKALTLAKRARLDWIPALIPEHYPEQVFAPRLAGRFVPLPLSPPTVKYVVFNSQRSPLKDRRTRHAVALLLDHASLAQPGQALAVATPVWQGGMANAKAKSLPAFDPQRASQLLEEAGWIDEDGDGKRERAGRPLRVEFLVTNSPNPRHEAMIRNLRRSGFRVVVLKGPAAVLLKRMRVGSFDMGIAEYQGYMDQDLSLLLHSRGTNNLGRLSSPSIDRLLETLRSSGSPEARIPVFAQLGDLLMTEWPIAALTTPDPQGVIHSRVTGVEVWDGWVALRQLGLGGEE